MSPTSYQTAPPRGGPLMVLPTTTSTQVEDSLRLRGPEQRHQLVAGTGALRTICRHLVVNADVIVADRHVVDVAVRRRTLGSQVGNRPRHTIGAVHQVGVDGRPRRVHDEP